MKDLIKVSVLVWTFVLIAGCAKPPQEAVESASVLIEDARMQEADVFAPELYSAAKDSFQAAQTEIELQQGKFALMRNYDAAKQLLASAAQLAREAGQTGAVRKQEMRTEADSLLVQAKETAARARSLLAKAPTGKEGRIALVAIASDVDSLDGMFTEVETLLASGNVKSAHDRVQVALQRAQGLTQELEQAIEKTRPGNRRG